MLYCAFLYFIPKTENIRKIFRYFANEPDYTIYFGGHGSASSLFTEKRHYHNEQKMYFTCENESADVGEVVLLVIDQSRKFNYQDVRVSMLLFCQ